MVARWGHDPKVAGSNPAAATMKRDNDIELYLADTLIGRPYGFSVDVGGEARRFFLYPPTLGKVILVQQIVSSMSIDYKMLNGNISFEALRLAHEKKEECLEILYFNTCKTKDEVFDNPRKHDIVTIFRENLTEEDIAALIIVVLTSDRTSVFLKYIGLDKEQDRIGSIMRVKSNNDKNNFSFGGLSKFGAILDVACERYGWTKDYVVWGIDYPSLKLMLADKPNSIYVTDDERKKLPASVRGTHDKMRVNGDDKKAIKAAIKSQNWD